MALKAYPLNDTDYTAEDAQLYTATRTSGVYADNHFNISVTGADNNVTIKPGMGWMKLGIFQGIAVANTEDVTINAGVPDSVLPRIDAIVYAYDANANKPEIIIKQGEKGTTPTPPAVVRDDFRHELHLYHIWRRPGATAITPGDVTDLRMDANYCGLMADSVTQVDMSAINAQVREFISDWENQIANVTDGKMIEAPEYPGCYYRLNRGVKEWLNPPMMEDVEYPTTKRQDGKRVYTKLLKARSQAGSVSLPDIERIVSVSAVAELDWNGEKLMFQLPVDFLPKDAPTIQKMQIYYQGNTIVFQSVVAKGMYNLYITVEYTKPGDEVAYTNVTAEGDTVNVETNGDVSAQGDSLNVEMFTTVSADGGAYIRRLTINGVAYDLAVGQAGSGAPGMAYPGIPGMFYTDIDSGAVYVCLKANPTLGIYIWSDIIPENLYVKNIKFRHDIGIGYAEITADKQVVNIQNDGADAVIRGVAAPVNANDAANKQYVDSKIGSGGVNGSNVTPQMFGAAGDGETDDTAAIQAMFDAVGDGGLIYFPAGTYVVRHSDTKTGEDYVAVTVRGRHGLRVVLAGGAMIKHKAAGVGRYTMLRFEDCDGVEISGGIIEGDRQEHQAVSSGYGSKGIHIVNSSNIHIHDMEVRSIWGDCIGATGMAMQCDNVLIENCDLHDSYRNGITIGGAKNSTVRNCHIYGIVGGDPQAGIDLEAEWGIPNTDITIDGSYIHDCAGNAVAFSSNGTGTRVRNCRLDGNTIFDNTHTGVEITGTDINGTANFQNDVVLRGCSVTAVGCYDTTDHPGVSLTAYNTIFNGGGDNPAININGINGVATLRLVGCELNHPESSGYALVYSYNNDNGNVDVMMEGCTVSLRNGTALHRQLAHGKYRAWSMAGCTIAVRSATMDYSFIRTDADQVRISNCTIDLSGVESYPPTEIGYFWKRNSVIEFNGNVILNTVAISNVLCLEGFTGTAHITNNTAPMCGAMVKVAGSGGTVVQKGNITANSATEGGGDNG